MHTDPHTHRSTHTDPHTQTHTDTHRHTHRHTQTHTQTHRHTDTQTHTHTHTHRHTQIQRHTHTHTQTHTDPQTRTDGSVKRLSDSISSECCLLHLRLTHYHNWLDCKICSLFYCYCRKRTGFTTSYLRVDGPHLFLQQFYIVGGRSNSEKMARIVG